MPKVVPSGSTPETTGGMGAGKWMDLTDATLHAKQGSREQHQ